MIENKGINTVMNSFNRLSYTYRFIFNRKILYDYNRKNAQNFVFSKKMPIFAIQKKTIKLTIMGKETKTSEKRNFRITIIFKDEITVERFQNEYIARDTIKKMKELFPTLFIGAALEEKGKSWNVIWTLGNN